MRLSELPTILLAFFFVMVLLLIGKRGGRKSQQVLYSETSEPKKQCAHCGAMILQRTADTYGGLCESCHRKAAAISPDDFELPHDLTSLNNLRLKAVSGHAESEYQLGMMYWMGRYMNGEFIGPDMRQAQFLIKSAAAKGYTEAMQFLNKNKCSYAIEDYNQALIVNPNDIEFYSKRGAAYAENSLWDLAIAAFDQALKINPQLVEAYSIRATAYTKKHQWDRAIEDYNQILKINPKDVEVYNKRATIYTIKSQWDRAIEDYDQILKINPQDAEVYSKLGTAYAQKGQWDRAIESFDQALKINPHPKDGKAYSKRGTAYAQKGQWDRAIKDYDQAIKINPCDAEAYRGRGAAERRLQLDRAIIIFDQALKINSQDARTYYNRGMAYKEKGQWDLAGEDFKQALKINSQKIGNRKQYIISHHDGMTHRLLNYEIIGTENSEQSKIVAKWSNQFDTFPIQKLQGQQYQISGISSLILDNYEYFISLCKKEYKEDGISDCSTNTLIIGDIDYPIRIDIYAAEFICDDYPELKKWVEIMNKIDDIVMRFYFEVHRAKNNTMSTDRVPFDTIDYRILSTIGLALSVTFAVISFAEYVEYEWGGGTSLGLILPYQVKPLFDGLLFTVAGIVFSTSLLIAKKAWVVAGYVALILAMVVFQTWISTY